MAEVELQQGTEAHETVRASLRTGPQSLLLAKERNNISHLYAEPASRLLMHISSWREGPHQQPHFTALDTEVEVLSRCAQEAEHLRGRIQIRT